jgi:hypothetical protein
MSPWLPLYFLGHRCIWHSRWLLGSTYSLSFPHTWPAWWVCGLLKAVPLGWLVPGHLPGRPITPARLGERLRALGIRTLPGRRATLLQLAAEVPAAVLAELLHLTPATATRWTRDAGSD